MPFEVNSSPFRTNAISPFDPQTDTPAFDTRETEGPAFWSETVPAAFRRENPLVSFLSSTAPIRHMDEWDPDYDVFDDLSGYEDFADRLGIARNKRHADQIKTDIRAEREAEEVLASAGGLGLVAGMAAGTLSPEVLMPAGSVYRGAKGGYSLLRTGASTAKWGAAGMAVSEGALQASQQSRTAEESAINIGAGTFLAGGIGAATAKFLGRAGINDLAPRVEKDLFVPEERDLVDRMKEPDFVASREEVLNDLLGQLEGTGRFGTEVNRDYADMLSRVYATQAARQGVSPADLYAQYPVRIEGDTLESGVFNQAALETPEFRNWFGDSKVVDDTGTPKVMYHGTARAGFDAFDTYGSNYGLMGKGAYFTENPHVASEYTDKGASMMEHRGEAAKKGVYPVYLSIKNPIDMDAPADLSAWKDALPDYVAEGYFRETLGPKATNEAVLREVEEILADEYIPDYEGADIIQEGMRRMGYDGITHMGGGRVQTDGPRHRVYIAFDAEQIKSVHNRGTFDPANPNILFQSLEEIKLRYKRDLNTLMSGKMLPINQIMQLGLTPRPLQAVGMRGHPLRMPPSVVRKAVQDKHAVPRDVIERLPDLIADPVAVMKSSTDGYIVLLDAQDTNGLPVIASIHVDQAHRANVIASVYGRAKPVEWFNEQFNKGRLLYARNEKSLARFKQSEKQYLGGKPHSTGAGEQSLNTRILTKDDLVKAGRFTQGARGAFNPDNWAISLFRNADKSTFLHEAGHFYLELMNRMSREAGAAPAIKADLEAALKWLGVKDIETWNARTLEEKRAAHEKFAKGFEAYLMEGRAPNPEVAGVFDRFKSWLVEIYKTVQNLGVEINDEIRGVYDRMIGTAGRAEESSLGAMQVPKQTLEQNSLKGALGLEWLTKKMNISPVVRLMNSPSLEVRQIFQMLDEVPVFLNKNAQGVPTEQAVTTYMKEYNNLLARSTQALNDLYKTYRVTGRGRSGKWSFEQFKEQVSMALRRGDEHHNPAVEQAARAYRPTLNRMRDEAIEAGLLPDDVTPQFADSYLTRAWDPVKIQMQEKLFRSIIRDWAAEKAQKIMRAAQADYNRKLNSMRREIGDLEMANLRTESDMKNYPDLPDDLKVMDAISLLQYMREQKPPKKPQTLMAFLRSKGGLQDIGGELKHMGLHNKARPGFVNKNGLTLDDATNLAWQEGFFPGHARRPDINDLLELVRDEFEGRAIPVRERDIDTLLQIQEYDDMIEALDQIGIDTADLDKSLNRLTEMKDGTRHFKQKVNEVTIKRRQARIEALRKKMAEIEQEKHLEMDTRFDIDNDMESYLDEVVDGIYDTLTRRAVGDIEEGFVVATRGPLRAKTLDIKDIEVERFLNNDIDMIMRKHVRTIAAEVELKRKFGDPTMKDQIEMIKDDYDVLRQQNPNAAKELAAREKSDIEDLEMIRDVIRGTYDDGTSEGWKRLGRMARAWNYVTKMGSVAVSSFPDVAGTVMKHGLSRTFGDLIVPAMKGGKGLKMQAEEARLAGHVTENVLASRMMELSDLRDPFAQGTAFERFIHNSLAPAFSKLTLMNRWNDLMKTIASAGTQSRILHAAQAAANGKISAKEREYLAFLGIDRDMAGHIARQFKAFGETVDGVPVANTARWDNREAQRFFRAALNKEVDSIIVSPGISDKPLVMQTELGKVIFQFRSFFFAANQRVLMRGLQQRDAAFLHGTLLAVTAGMMVAWFKAKSRGEDTDTWSPQKWIAEGVDQSGITSVMLELNNTWEKSGLPGLYTALGEAPASRYVNRNQTGALLGPTFGLGQDIFRGAYLAGNPSEIKESDLRAIRRLVPYQNLFYVRPVFDKVMDETADALDAK